MSRRVTTSEWINAVGGIEAALAEHAFEHLFIECLGWDRFRTLVTIGDNGAQMELTGVAQKRGFAVFVSPSHRTVLANRGLLRDVQRQIRRSHHEHILIHFCETPRKQVWQWATTTADGRRILHREHPFFSNEPPARLLERIQGMSISFDEEEQTGLTDVLARVRAALAPDSELNLFSKHPRYAVESDRLALAMRSGEPNAFAQFINLHRPLVRHASKRLVRWFSMSPEDAEQTALIGLIVAARRWEPERGYQFSTYAHHWLLHACERYGQKWGTWFHVPAHWFFPCYRLMFTRSKLIATHGERDAESRFDEELAAAGISRQQWTTFCAARHVDHLSDLGREESAGLRITDEAAVVTQALSEELGDEIRRSLKCIPARHAEILRLRYGIDEREHTLEEVGERMGITRERVRQLQAQAEEKLQRVLGKKDLFDDGVEQLESGAECPKEEVTP